MISGAGTTLLLAALLGCGAPAATPEQQVRAALAALEAAAEAGDAGAFAELVSAGYQDPYGHDREKLRAFVGAEVYAVDMDLARERDGWRVAWAQWHAAPATDLF
jgi:hypothetical protein